jgi:DNA-binding transcriptional MerR regulator
MNQPKELFSIGGFANMTRLSIKALRLYDQLGILQPHHIDPQTGYRYYGPDQLSSARMIRVMREMDMPLATIRQVLASMSTINAPSTEIEWLVNEYVEMRERQVEQIRGQVHQLIQLVHQEVEPMSLKVNIRTIAPQQVLSITSSVKVDKLDTTIKQSLDKLYKSLQEQKLEAADAPFGIFHGQINEQEDGPIEVCLPANGTVKATGGAVLKTLSGGEATSVMMVGAQCDFPAILGGYDAAADWIQKNGYEMAERPREVWHNPPIEKAKMEGADVRMEIVWLFK